jgi:phosphotransferase system enzyme I (PtsI)
VGLFRSEFLFMNRNGALPDEEEQFEAYRDAVLALQGCP